MARQKGIIKLKGTIGDVSFYKSKDGYLAREKGGVDADRIKNDPAFQRTRENGSEFGRAGKAGKLLRDSLRLMLQNASDSKVASRLTKEMLRAIQKDQTNVRGARNIVEGELELLTGFDFNIEGKLNATLYAPFNTTVDRAGGSLAVDIPDFIPGNSIAFPSGATHFKILAGAAEVDFEEEVFNFSKAETGEILLDQNPTGDLNLNAGITAATDRDLFLVLGLEFMQEVNGAMYPLKNGAYNPLTIIEVDRVEPAE
jgi:hypothetical protein